MKQANNAAETVVKMILSACDAKQPVGIFGQLMLEYANKEKEGMITDEDRALFEKMRTLKFAEEDGDLVWMEYSSWNALNARLRDEWTKALDPLFWNGVFCKFSNYIEYELALLRRLGPLVVVNLVRVGKNHQLFCVDFTDREYNLMKTKDFDKLRARVNAKIIRSFAVGADRKLVKREFKYDTEGETGHARPEEKRQDDSTTTAL